MTIEESTTLALEADRSDHAGGQPGAVATEAVPHTPMRRGRVLRRLLQSKAAVVGLVVIGLLVLMALLAPWLAPNDPNKQDLLNTLASPSKEHRLGTDTLGRDIVSRLIYGSRVSLMAGAEAVAVAFLLGVPTGLIAGYRGGWIDRALVLLNDSLLSVPGLVLALAVIAALGTGLVTAMLAVGIVMMPRFFRLTRATTQDLNKEMFIVAERSLGCTRRTIVFRHILPNAMPPLIVQVSLVLGTAILSEASLSFLGLGVEAPTASWGSMLADAGTRLDKQYLIWGPGIALTLTVLAFALVGDGLRDALGIGRSGKR